MLPNQDPPDGWPQPRRSATRVLSVIGFGLLTLLAVAITVAAIDTGDVAQATIFAFSALLFAHLAGMSVSTMRRPAPAPHRPSAGHTDQGEPGVAFPYARAPYYWLSMVLGLVALFAAGLAILLAAGGTVAGWVVAVIAAACALFLGWFLVVLLRLAPGTIVLTPTGIYHRSLVLEHFVPWEAVVDVQAREARSPWITVKAMPATGTRELRHTGPLGSFESQALPFMVARAYWLGANAVPAYRCLKQYFEHPAERPELASAGQSAGH